ncbi:MAG: SRPBCC family protein [Ramlibacter sp.]
MWTQSYSKTVSGLSAAQVWKVWSDVDRWHLWQDDIEFARMNGPFESGGSFKFKPKGGPNLTLELSEVRPGEMFVDITRFPLARMVDSHEIIKRGDALEIKTTVRMEGPLAFLWRKLVGEDVVKSLPAQTDNLIAQVALG